MKHLLIIGYMGVGKSTLIRELVQETNRPVAGFLTKKEDALADEINGSPIYIYEPGKPKVHGEENLLGYCKNRQAITLPGSFDRWARKLLAPVVEDAVLVFDEIGFMESREASFCEAIRQRLEGNNPIIAAVKDKETDFLMEIRQHPRCQCLFLTPDNRESVREQALELIRQWRKNG